MVMITAKRSPRYDEVGSGYACTRREDARFRAQIHAALGDARTVVNVGAGTGSYEPRDRLVIAIEPSPECPAGSASAGSRSWLDAQARRATSGFARMAPAIVDRIITVLERDLARGDWDRRYGHLRQLDSYDVGLRLIINTPGYCARS
jgi:hypothetical protein